MDVRLCPFRRLVTGRLCQGRATALAVGLLLVVAAFPAAPALAGAGQRLTALSPQEQAWLAEHPVVLLAPDADFPPIEFFDEQGQYRGIAADYAALVEQRLESKLPAYVAFVIGAVLLLSVITLAWNRSLKSQVRQKVADLQIELEQRRRAEQALEEARLELERRVGERTSELEKSNRLLVEEIGERKRIQHDLDRFKTTLDRTLDCVFMFDPQTLKFFYVNAGAVAQVGYSSDELLNMTPLDIKPDMIAGEFQRRIQPLRNGEQDALTFETVHRHKDGRRIPVEIFLQYIVPGNEIPRFVAIVRDITERKRIDAELSWNNRQIDLTNRAQTAFIANTDHQEAFELLLAGLLDLAESAYGFMGEVLYTDDGAPYLCVHAISNVARDEQTRAFFEDHAPTGLEFFNLDTLIGAALTTGRPVLANDPARDERRGGLPPGHPALASFLGLPLFAGKRLVGMAGIANRPGGYDQALVDSLAAYMNTCATLIEEYRSRQLRQHAEEQVKQSEERLRAVVSNVLESIITIDTSGIVESVNPATEKIFGYTAAEIVGQHVRMLMPEPHRGAHDQYLHNYLSSQGAKIIGSGREVPGRRKDGSTVALELGVTEIAIAGRRAFVGVLRDITERKQTEATLLRARAELKAANEQLLKQARADGLTGIANRRYFDEVLDQEIRRAARAATPLSLILCDIDYFKDVIPAHRSVRPTQAFSRSPPITTDPGPRPPCTHGYASRSRPLRPRPGFVISGMLCWHDTCFGTFLEDAQLPFRTHP